MVKKLSVCFAVLLISACGTINQAKDSKNMKASNQQQIRIDTFDSGFGGYFTANAIEKSAQQIVKTKDAAFTIHHFGDTKFAPYGEKTPEQIAELTAYGVKRALSKGSDTVFIACNTASTQYPAVVRAVEAEFPGRGKDVISIIQSSAEEAKKKLGASA
jgi:glutamate racemase